MSIIVEKIGLVNRYDPNIIFNKEGEFPSYIKIKANCEVALRAVLSGDTNTKIVLGG